MAEAKDGCVKLAKGPILPQEEKTFRKRQKVELRLRLKKRIQTSIKRG